MTAHRLGLALAMLLLPAGTAAQIVTGLITDNSGAPMRGAFVQLMGTDAVRLGAVLSDGDGRFVLRTPPGTYTLTIDLIGHKTATVDRFAVDVAETRSFEVRLEPSAVKLQAIQVTSSRRCRINANAAHATSAVWKEAARALEITRWAESGGAGVFRARVYEQQLDEALRPARVAEQRFASRGGNKAFAAISPDTLSQYGFIREESDGVRLYGPDAELLLSDVFLQDHCFWLERDPKLPGLIGLGFEPAPRRRVPDIRGVLWLDEKTSALRFIDYKYVNKEHYENARYAGGRTEFEHLSSGAWIVRKWYVRAPQLARNQYGTIRVIGAFETGGEVLDVTGPNQVATKFVNRFTVTGLVYDSIRRGPLPDAQVYLAGTNFGTRTDANGVFIMPEIPEGSYQIAFSHPRMDSLPEYPRPAELRVDASLDKLHLAIASPATIAETWCGPAERLRTRQMLNDTTTTSRGYVYGLVRTADGPLEGAVVSLKWNRLEMPTPYLRDAMNRPAILEFDTDHSGRFAFCGAPIDHPVTLEVLFRNRLIIEPDLRLGYDALLYREFVIKPER